MLGLRCLHTNTFMETLSLEGLPTKAKEDPSPQWDETIPTGHPPSISWYRGAIIIIIINIIIVINFTSNLLFSVHLTKTSTKQCRANSFAMDDPDGQNHSLWKSGKP